VVRLYWYQFVGHFIVLPEKEKIGPVEKNTGTERIIKRKIFKIAASYRKKKKYSKIWLLGNEEAFSNFYCKL
jgi:hypothetical protein